ncbi:MAG: CPBP family intramembrane metalloprotease [Desulfobulbaceae bacterium]|nr:MAG: CPBP family intramembrane metalloprotease [Desulfobulbaceae bacterium]
MRYRNKNVLRVEFFLLCLVVPGIIMVNKWAPQMFLFLWAATIYGYLVMRLVYRDRLRTLWNWQAVCWQNLKPVLIRWLIACVGMTLFLLIYDPDRLFGLFHYRPEIIPFLLVLYPVVSALPQEFIFCSFFFERYKDFFGSGSKMVIASGVMFAYAHCLYINPVAPTLSFFGGLIFASTYRKTNSLALVTIEHGLYGNFLFLIGLGFYFYGGNVQ